MIITYYHSCNVISNVIQKFIERIEGPIGEPIFSAERVYVQRIVQVSPKIRGEQQSFVSPYFLHIFGDCYASIIQFPVEHKVYAGFCYLGFEPRIPRGQRFLPVPRRFALRGLPSNFLNDRPRLSRLPRCCTTRLREGRLVLRKISRHHFSSFAVFLLT